MRRLAALRHGQDGAVAPMVAIFIVLFFGLAAFAVDAGLAYNEDRRLATGLDAAALAAAQEYRQAAYLCEFRSQWPPQVNVDGQAAASSQLGLNVTGTNGMSYQTDCTATGALVVTVGDSKTIDTSMGRVISVDELTAAERAAAQVQLLAGDDGIRPVGVCNSEVDPSNYVSGFMVVDMDKNADCAGLPGNWRELDCPESKSNGSKAYGQNVLNGCGSPVYPVQYQPAGGEGTGGFTTHMQAACNGLGNKDSDEDCLRGNPGNGLNKHASDAWKSLISAGDSVRMPVLGNSSICPASGCNFGNGNTAAHPVYKIVAATPCGINGHGATVVDNSGVCSGAAGARTTADSLYGEWMIFKVHGVYAWNDEESTVGEWHVSLVRPN